MKSMPLGTPKGGQFENNSNQHMFGFRGAGEQKPDRSSQEGSGGRRDQKAKAGGKVAFVSSGAHNTDYAGTQEPGTSGPTKSGGNQKFAEGGKTSMFGNRGSQRAKAGCSAPD